MGRGTEVAVERLLDVRDDAQGADDEFPSRDATLAGTAPPPSSRSARSGWSFAYASTNALTAWTPPGKKAPSALAGIARTSLEKSACAAGAQSRFTIVPPRAQNSATKPATS